MTFFLNFFCSFKYAINGIAYTFSSQRNMVIHVILAILVVIMGLYFSISTIEWLFIFSAVAMVLVTEMINTSIEILVDLVTKKRKFRAMLIKDVAAGAVLLSALYSLFVGLIIFLPKFLFILKG